MAIVAIESCQTPPAASTATREAQLQQWFKAISLAVLFVLAWYLLSPALAGSTDEFAEAATQGEGWIRGNLGKIACLLALVVGMFWCAMRKDWSWMVNAVFIALVIGIVVGLINNAFTAVI